MPEQAWLRKGRCKDFQAGLRELAGTMVRIPMAGSASSLNVACAASIVLYELERQRARPDE